MPRTSFPRELPRELLRKLPLPRKIPRKLPRIRKPPRKHFHGVLGFSSMEASGSFHGRSEAQRLPRKLPRKLFVKAFEVASTKSWKLHPPNFTFYFHGSFRSLHGISAASTTATTDILVLHITVPPVELTIIFSNMVDAHCVRDEGGFTVHWLVGWWRFIGLGLGYIYNLKSMSTTCRKLSQKLSWQ